MSLTAHYTPETARLISKLPPELKKLVRSPIDSLCEKPEQGTELVSELAGYWSVHVRRYRIIYKVDSQHARLEVIYFGHRRDIYETLQQLLSRNQ